jgi:hypothetical protein
VYSHTAIHLALLPHPVHHSTRHAISRIGITTLNLSAMLLEPIHKSEHARLRSPSQIRVIDMLQAKSGRLSRTPLEIWQGKRQRLPPAEKERENNPERDPRSNKWEILTVENRPPPSPSNINPIINNRRQNIIQVPLIIVTPPQIPQNRLQTRELRLKRLRETKLRHLNIRHTGEQIFRDLAQELADSGGIVVEPVGPWVRRGTYRKAVGCRLRGLRGRRRSRRYRGRLRKNQSYP